MSTPPAQIPLFDLSPDYWQRLQETKEKVMRSSGDSSKNTFKTYAHAWKVFAAWCAGVGLNSLPASPETVEDFIAWCMYERERKYRLATVQITLSAIVHYHVKSEFASPVTDDVRLSMRKVKRDVKERRRCKKALTPEVLRRVCSSLRSDDVINIRDRAMFLIQFAAGWRCSEVAGLQLSDVSFTSKGFVVTLGASKTDQDGKEGRQVGIEFGEHPDTCPVLALRAWIDKRKKRPGPLFCRIGRWGDVSEHGLIGDAINERLKIALAAIGVNARDYGSHSLRAGMVTAGIERGASETLIMLRTGHKSLDVMRGYVRLAKAFSEANPMAGVL